MTSIHRNERFIILPLSPSHDQVAYVRPEAIIAIVQHPDGDDTCVVRTGDQNHFRVCDTAENILDTVERVLADRAALEAAPGCIDPDACPACKGDGHVAADECRVCGGTGER